MPQVSWLPEALADIQRLHKFLYEKNPAAAARAATIILNGTKLLKTNPRIGRPMPDETDRRELFMAFGAGAYVLRYKPTENDLVIIIRIWHSRENRAH
ncbi:MAG: type II toxin-antitoxin system RelE/ParE family toxin [Candidatus Saccharimonadales bacterium]